MSHRLLRGTLMPFTTGLAAALTMLVVLGFAPAVATARTTAVHGTTRDQEWWLARLHVTQAWQQSEGAGITVAVLGTGVAADYPGLSVITGPDYTGSGRGPGSPYWGVEGTAVAGVIAAHEPHWGLVGVAPAATILSVRVTLEFNDPLAFDLAISRRLPDAIAAGITYATDHGARIIDLPLDPGTLGLTSAGDPAAAGGSPAERAAIGYALSKGVVLVAPAGDDAMGSGIVNYPAAYPGVIAVGAIGLTGQLASFSSTRSHAAVTAPGVSLVAAAPPNDYNTISSTSTASGIVAGLAALVLSRFPHLTVAQVTQVLLASTATTAAGSGLPRLPTRPSAGAGYGTVDATRALNLAAIIAAENQPRPATRTAPPRKPARPARPAVAATPQPAASTLAGSVLRDAVAAVSALIILLVVALLIVRSRRDRGRAGPHERARTRGQHESRRPDRGPAADADHATAAGDARVPGWSQAARPSPPASPGWASPAGWQGGGIGEVKPAIDPSFRPVVAPAPRSSFSYRASRGVGRTDGDPGPPWPPAPEPERVTGPLTVASAGPPPPPPQPGRGIRVPGDMARPGAATDLSPPVSFDLTSPSADFDLSAPAFGVTPPAFGSAPPTFDAAPTVSEEAGSVPARARLGFAPAPVPADYAAPPAGPAADPSYIWDLAATDVFPAATEPAATEPAATEPALTDAAVPPDDAPGT